MKIYTRNGDKGETSLFGGKKISKDTIYAHVLGDLDELNASLGIALCYISDIEVINLVQNIQKDLLNIGAEIAIACGGGVNSKNLVFEKQKIDFMESKIDQYTETLPLLKNFILPGGTLDSSYCHLARAVCRRLERNLVALNTKHPLNPYLVAYINRLSDLLFTLARYANKLADVEDIKWIQ